MLVTKKEKNKSQSSSLSKIHGKMVLKEAYNLQKGTKDTNTRNKDMLVHYKRTTIKSGNMS